MIKSSISAKFAPPCAKTVCVLAFAVLWAPVVRGQTSTALKPVSSFSLSEISAVGLNQTPALADDERIFGFDVRAGKAFYLVQRKDLVRARVVSIDPARRVPIATKLLPNPEHRLLNLRALDGDSFLAIQSTRGLNATITRHSFGGGPPVDFAVVRPQDYSVAGNTLFILQADGTLSARDLAAGKISRSVNIGPRRRRPFIEAIDKDTVLLIDRTAPSFTLIRLSDGTKKDLQISAPALDQAIRRAQADLRAALDASPDNARGDPQVVIVISSYTVLGLGTFVLLGEGDGDAFSLLQLGTDGTLRRTIRCSVPASTRFIAGWVAVEGNRLFVTSMTGQTFVYWLGEF